MDAAADRRQSRLHPFRNRPLAGLGRPRVDSSRRRVLARPATLSRMADHPTNAAVRLTDGNFYALTPSAPPVDAGNAPVLGRGGTVWGITLYADVLALEKDPQTWRSSGGIRPDSRRCST